MPPAIPTLCDIIVSAPAAGCDVAVFLMPAAVMAAY